MATARIGVAIPAVVCLVTVAAATRGARADGDALADVEQRQQALFAQISPAVVFIAAGEGFGSGFFVTHTGLILTNAHVVRKVESVKVVTAEGTSYIGKVVARAGESVDLALVQVPAESTPALTLLAKPDLQVGAWVASVGHGRGGVWSFNTGMISNIYPDGADRPIFQTQIPLNPGNSGGPVVDRRGRVIGVVTAGVANSNSINFAIRTEVALRAFKQLDGECDCLTIRAPSGATVFVDGKMVGTGPHLVVAATPRTYEVFAVIDGVMKKMRVRYPSERTVDLK